MNTPFPFEYIANKETFYGREAEIKEIISHIENSTNILLFSKRRMGKSTLIKNVFEKLEKTCTVVYVDIFNIITAEDFAEQLLKALAKTQKGDIKKTIKSLMNIFKRTRVEPTFDPRTGEMGVKTVVGNSTFEEMMEDFFNALFEVAKKQNVALAIDEFQQIATIKDKKIDSLLRKYMQENSNISYIFLGSKRNLLNSLFQYKSPLYSMATPISLKGLSVDAIFAYSKKHLNISKEMVEYIYDISSQETKLIQMILHRLYMDKKTIKNIDEESINIIIDNILVSKNDHYKSLFEFFSTNQKKAFKLLIKHKKELFSNHVLQEENISRASMQSSLKQLFDKEFIDKEDDIYFIPDRTFELWGEKVFPL